MKIKLIGTIMCVMAVAIITSGCLTFVNIVNGFEV